MIHDYTRKGGIVHAEIMLPAHAPPEFADRSILWNSVEQIEKARDSQLAREIEAALPRELSDEQQLGSAAVSSCGNGRTACAALDDTDGDMTEIYGEHLLSVRGIAGSVEPDKRKAGVRRLRRAHKGFGERSFPSRTKNAGFAPAA